MPGVGEGDCVNTAAVVGLVLAGLAALSLVIVVFWYLYRRRYTRERFAFRAFFAIVSLAATFVAVLLAGGDMVETLVAWVCATFGWDPPQHSQPTLSDKILALLAIATLMYYAVALHKNWKGAISVEEHERAEAGIDPSILNGTLVLVRHLRAGKDLEIYEPDKRSQDQGVSITPTQVRAWHLRVAGLLQLSSQYQIDVHTDWHNEEGVFVSRYGKHDHPLFVLCATRDPTEETLNNLIYSATWKLEEKPRFVVAVQGDGERRTHRIGDHEVVLRYESELLDSMVNLDQYKQDIVARYEKHPVAKGYALAVSDVYMPSHGFLRNASGEVPIESVEELLLAWAEEDSWKHIALLGEYGQGKSVLALRLTYELLQREGSRIPILIPLRGRSPRNLNELELLAAWAAPYGINPQAIFTLHEAGRVLLIFDGFDEMDLVGEPSLRFDNFRRLWEFAKSRGSKLLITGRPNFFFDEREKETSLNVFESGQRPYTQAVYLRPFTLKQTRGALRGFSASVRDGVLQFIESGDAPQTFVDLISRPSTLFLAANCWDELRARDEVEEINSAIVISRFIGHAYERQQVKYTDAFLSVLERHYFMVGIARRMLDETVHANSIMNSTLVSVVRDLFESFPGGLSKFEPAVEKKREPLQSRLKDGTKLLDTILTDVIACGILVHDLARPGSFQFAHKSFFEYLVAFHAVHPMQIESDDQNVVICRAIRRKRVAPLNPEMIRFAGEILASLVRKEPGKRIGLMGALRRLKRVTTMPSMWVFALSAFLFFRILVLRSRRTRARNLQHGTWPIIYRYLRELRVGEDEMRRLFGPSLVHLEEACNHSCEWGAEGWQRGFLRDRRFLCLGL